MLQPAVGPSDAACVWQCSPVTTICVAALSSRSECSSPNSGGALLDSPRFRCLQLRVRYNVSLVLGTPMVNGNPKEPGHVSEVPRFVQKHGDVLKSPVLSAYASACVLQVVCNCHRGNSRSPWFPHSSSAPQIRSEAVPNAVTLGPLGLV